MKATNTRIARSTALFSTALVLLAAVIVAGCSSEAAAPAANAPPEVSVAEVLTKDVQLWDEFTGRVEAIESVELRPRVSGYIERVAYAEGQEVEEGDLLFVIDQRRYRAELDRAIAELERARTAEQLAASELVRAEKLVAAKAISREEFDASAAAAAQGKAAVRAAEAAVDSARLDMRFTEVRAPISGRAGRALVTAGNLAQADATLLTTIVSIDPVYVYFESDECTYLRHLALTRNGKRAESGQTVRVGLGNEDGFPHVGEVDFTDNQVDPGTGTILARAVLENPERIFTPGMFARVQVQGGAEADALLIDEKAVLTDQDRKYVYVLGPDDTAQRRDIVPGRIVDGLRVVESGLSPGDLVIVHGVQKVFFSGAPVNPTPIEMGGPPGGTRVAVN